MINDLEIVQWDYLLDPAFQLVNTAGKPLTNGWIEVYIHGTRDKYYCASDFNGTLHPFQIPLDSLGSNIVLASPANAYDVYIYNVYGSLVMSRYNVKPGSGSGSGVIPADASYGIFGTNELPMNNTSNTGFQFTAKDIGGDDITFHEITYPYGRIDCKEGVYFYSATIEVSNTSTSNESVKFQVLAGKNPNQSVYWLDFDNTYLHKQLYTICGIANFVNEDTFRINVSPYQLTNGVKASASQVAIHKLSTVVEGEGGGGGHEYGAGWGILINNDEISVDPSIIPTIEYVDASVSAVSSTLISTIESVSGNLQDQIDNIPVQVQSDWNQDDDTQVDYIKNKPDLTVYATHDEVCAVSSVLQNEIDNIDMSEYVTHTELNSTVTAVSSVLENEIQIVSAAIPDVSDFVTHDEVSAVSSNLVEYVDNSINNVSGDLVEYIDNSVSAASGNLVNYIDESVNNVSGDLIEYVDNSVNTASGNLVQYIDDSITEVNETIENVSGNIINEVNETINNVSGDLVEYIDNSVGAVSGDIIEYVDNTVNNVSGVLESEIQIVSGAIPVVTGYATKDEVNTVSSTIINTIEVVSGAIQDTIESVSGNLQEQIDNIPEQVNADWDAVSGKAEILNKPDLSVYATHDEVDGVSGTIIEYIDDSIDVVNNNVTAVSSVLNDKIDTVSGAIIHYQGASGVNVDGDTISLEDPLYIEAGDHIEFSQDGDNITISADVSDIEADIQEVSGKLDELSATVASASGIEYGQFYSTGITTTPATMARVKGNILVDNGRIQLKKGSSYHVTVRGRYNQTTAANTNTAVGYIEYVSNNTINVNVDKTITDSQYFEISYDLFNLSNNVDYLVWFTGTDGGTVNDLWIEVHSLTGIGGQGGGTGPGVEYTAGYGIQILNNVISVSGIAPQVQSDWNATSGMAQILNKPEEQKLVPGSNITIAVSGVSAVISSVQSEGPQVQADWDAVSGASQILNRPDEYGLVAGDNIEISVSGNNIVIDSTASGDVTHADLETVSGALETDIMSVSSVVSAIPNDNIFWAIYGTTTWQEVKDAFNAGKKICMYDGTHVLGLTHHDYIGGVTERFYFCYVNKVWQQGGPSVSYRYICKRDGWYSNDNNSLQADWNQTNNYYPGYIKNKPDLTVYATNAVVTTVSGTLQTEIQSVSSAIPEEMSLVAGDNIEIQVSGASAIISSTATGDVTQADLEAVSGTLESEIQTVSGVVSGFNDPNIFNAKFYGVWNSGGYWETDYTLSTSYNDVLNAFNAGKSLICTVYSYINIGYVPIAVLTERGIATSNNARVIYFYGRTSNTTALQISYTQSSITGQSRDTQPNWNQTYTGMPDYIKNKPNLSVYATNAIVSSVSATLQTEIETVSASIPAELTGASGVKIEDDVASLDDPIFVKAGSGITITQDGDDIVISSTVTATPQVNADWTAVSGAAEILNKPNEYNLIAGTNVVITKEGNDVTISARGGGGGGSSYIAGTGINIDANDVISVSGVAMASAIDVVSGKLPTTEIGKITIHNNVSGGPIEVLIPTDQAPDSVLYQINSVSGYAYTPSYSNAVINYYYGETPADFNGSDDSVLFTINDSISNIYSIEFYYTQSETGMGGPSLTTTSILGDSNYTVQSGTYKVKAQYNQAGTSSPYGKYLQIMFNWKIYAVDTAQSLQWAQEALSKITFFGVVRPDPTLGTTVNLDRYYLGNTSTTTSTYGLTQATIYTDPTSKKQSVYLPSSMPNNWLSRVVKLYSYGSNRNGTPSYIDQVGIAYKSTSTGYQYAILIEYDNTNRMMTFLTYNETGDAIEKWTCNYSNSGSNVWTTTSITPDMSDYATEAELQAVSGAIPEEINLIPGSGITIEVSGASAVISSTGGGGGSTYTAGDFIDITNNVISVDDTSNVVAGNGINISQSGNNTTISLGVTAGITDIQLVNSLPASPTSTVLYLIPET